MKIEFLERDIAINTSSFKEGACLPRVGEEVYLPGIGGEGAGLYKVLRIVHVYGHSETEVNPGFAYGSKVAVYLERTCS